MKRKLQTIIGKQFVHPSTKMSYGLFRLPEKPGFFSTLNGQQYTVLAEDDCGNYITEMQDGSVCFWDHETDAMDKLSPSISEFISGCSDAEPIKLDPSQVKSAWIDPEFAKSLGIEAPTNGWVKKKS